MHSMHNYEGMLARREIQFRLVAARNRSRCRGLGLVTQQTSLMNTIPSH